MWTDTVESAPGTVTQVRGSAQALIRYAKRSGASVILVGHVTKDGQIAGPRVVEHMVDAVLSFEGDAGRDFRILRAIKNRFGPTDEIGVFEMTGLGLEEVSNPSALFLSERDLGSPGTAVFAGMEGTRPLLVEIQALVAPTTLGTPRRAVVGWDNEPPVDGAGRARGPLRRQARRSRRLPQCRRGPQDPGARRRRRRRRRPRLLPHRRAALAGYGLLRGDLAVGLGPAGRARVRPYEGGGEARFQAGDRTGRRRRAGRDRAVAVTRITSLSTLVADIAASGEAQRRTQAKAG